MFADFVPTQLALLRNGSYHVGIKLAASLRAIIAYVENE